MKWKLEQDENCACNKTEMFDNILQDLHIKGQQKPALALWSQSYFFFINIQVGERDYQTRQKSTHIWNTTKIRVYNLDRRWEESVWEKDKQKQEQTKKDRKSVYLTDWSWNDSVFSSFTWGVKCVAIVTGNL